MRNFIQPGGVLTAVAPAGGVVSGDFVLIGALFGIASTSAAEGEQFELANEGVYELPKVSAQAWTMGALVYWDSTAKNATTTASTNTKIGVAVADAANPSATGRVLLNQAR